MILNMEGENNRSERFAIDFGYTSIWLSGADIFNTRSELR